MAFLGMRGNGDWVTDQRPKNWREVILYRYPNGDMPLTAILSKMASEKTDDPEFNWWTKDLATQSATITGRYTDSTLGTSYVSGGVAGDFLYFKMSASDLTQIRIGHQVLLRDASDLTVDCVGKVVDRAGNGSSSYVKVKLLEDDDNSTAGDLSDADTLLIIGNINAEGAAMPDAVAYDPIKWYNFTQIFRSPLEMTRTAMQTRLQTGDQYKEAKRECLEMHGIEMEKAFLFGVPSESTGDNGKPERTTLGIIPAIKGAYTGQGGSAGTVNNFVTNTDYSGQAWLQGGEDWLDTQLEVIFRKGATEKLALAGSGAIQAINRLIKAGGNFDYTATTTSYGIKVTQWTTAFGVINLMRHPLFSYETTTRHSMVIFEPKDIKYRFIQDTMFKKDDRLKNGGWTSRDGIKEEYLTEAGLEFHHPDGCGYLYGFGTDNAV
jgi:hypothetical protein